MVHLFGLTEVGKGEKEKYLWEKKPVTTGGALAWEASVLTTEPP